jgi:hypothetical protein
MQAAPIFVVPDLWVAVAKFISIPHVLRIASQSIVIK